MLPYLKLRGSSWTLVSSKNAIALSYSVCNMSDCQEACTRPCHNSECETVPFEAAGVKGLPVMHNSCFKLSCPAGMHKFGTRGRALLWSAAGAELPLLVASLANFVWVLVVETGSAGDAWWIATLIVLAVLIAVLAAAVPLQLALSVSYCSQARAMQMHADGLKKSLMCEKCRVE